MSMRTLTFSSSEGECHNPTLRECKDETHTPEMGLGSPLRLLKLQSLIARVKTPRIGAVFISLENYQSVNVENGLTWGHLEICNTRYGKKKAQESD